MGVGLGGGAPLARTGLTGAAPRVSLALLHRNGPQGDETMSHGQITARASAVSFFFSSFTGRYA